MIYLAYALYDTELRINRLIGMSNHSDKIARMTTVKKIIPVCTITVVINRGKTKSTGKKLNLIKLHTRRNASIFSSNPTNLLANSSCIY